MSKEEQDAHKEKRASERVDLITELKYSILLPSFQSGLTRNISEKGLCFMADQQLPRGTVLQVEFDLHGEESGHVKAIAKVLWQKHEDGKFVTGVKVLT